MGDADRNVEILRETYRRYVAEGIEPVLERVTDDVEWRSIGPDALPWCGTYTGREGIGTFYHHLCNAAEVKGYEAHRIIAQDEWVVALAAATIRFKANGRVERFDKADIFRMRDGRIAEYREFYDTTKAIDGLRAAPLSPDAETAAR